MKRRKLFIINDVFVTLTPGHRIKVDRHITLQPLPETQVEAMNLQDSGLPKVDGSL